MKKDQEQPKNQEPTEELLNKIRQELPKNAKIRIINLKEIQNMYTRLGKVSNFHYIGAILCLIVALYFVQQGNQVVPFVLGLFMLLNTVLALLAYKATTKIEKILAFVQHEKHKGK